MGLFNDAGLITQGFGKGQRIITMGYGKVRDLIDSIRGRKKRDYSFILVAPVEKEVSLSWEMESIVEMNRDCNIGIGASVIVKKEWINNIKIGIDHKKLFEIIDSI